MAGKRKNYRRVKLQDIKATTRMLHSELSPQQSALSRYTYKHVGHYVCETYEQWETGFLRERDPDAELIIWMRIAAVIMHLKPQTTDKTKQLIAVMCIGKPSPEVTAAWEEIKETAGNHVYQAVEEFNQGNY